MHARRVFLPLFDELSRVVALFCFISFYVVIVAKNNLHHQCAQLKQAGVPKGHPNVEKQQYICTSEIRRPLGRRNENIKHGALLRTAS